MELFQGYNTWTGMPASTIATGEVSHEDVPTISRAKLCTDSVDLFQSLEVDASVSGSYGGFSADAKSKFYNSLKLTTNSITFLVYVSTRKSSKFTKVKIDAKVEKNLSDENQVAAFIKKYGDSWVSSVTKGTYYVAAFVFYAETKEQNSRIQASLGAQYSGGGVTANASVATDIQKALKETHVRCELFQTFGGVPAGNIPVINPIDPAGSAQAVMEYAQDFGKKEADNPVTVDYTVQGYETVFDTNVPFQEAINNRRAFNGDDATNGLGADYQALTQLKNKIDGIEAFYAFYGVSRDAELESKKTQVVADLKAAADVINAMGDDPEKKHEIPALESLSYGMPQPLIEFVNPPGWGYVGDTKHATFDDVTSDMVYARCRIAELSIKNGDRLDCLIVTYEVGGQALAPKVHGGENAPPTLQPATFSGATTPPEMVKEIQGYGGLGWSGTPAVNRIRIVSTVRPVFDTVHKDGSDDTKIKDHPSGAAWTYTKGGDVLVGFKGHADNALVILLQAVVVSFKETQWIRA